MFGLNAQQPPKPTGADQMYKAPSETPMFGLFIQNHGLGRFALYARRAPRFTGDYAYTARVFLGDWTV